MGVERSKRADEDLDDLWKHIATDNLEAANRVIRRIEAAEDRIAGYPLIGRARPELGRDVRSWPVGDYLVLYRPEGADVVVLRILHGARDLPSLLDES